MREKRYSLPFIKFCHPAVSSIIHFVQSEKRFIFVRILEFYFRQPVPTGHSCFWTSLDYGDYVEFHHFRLYTYALPLSLLRKLPFGQLRCARYKIIRCNSDFQYGAALTNFEFFIIWRHSRNYEMKCLKSRQCVWHNRWNMYNNNDIRIWHCSEYKINHLVEGTMPYAFSRTNATKYST